MANLFETHKSKNPSILLVDASGSVVANKFDNHFIFDKMREIIDKLDESEFRIIFWNSNKVETSAFKGGIKKLPFVVNKSTLSQAFNFVKKDINSQCLTFPHLSFDSIPDEWINNVDLTKIYLITDGEMGYQNITYYDRNSLKTALGESIARLFKKFNNIQLDIITVESVNRDFNQVEALTNAAGCDVYRVIIDNKLTKYVSKFISYTPNNLEGFIHINKNIPPPGFLPFGDKYFSELKMNAFIKHLSELITSAADENEILSIVQNLSATVSKLTKNKTQSITNDAINMFCSLFKNSSVDVMFVKYILTEAIANENEGTANVYATYRSKLKDLYKQASEMILKNVKESIGIIRSFITLPIENKIVTGGAKLINSGVKIDGTTYPCSGVLINNIFVPVVPLELDNLSAMNEQCLRQWIRIIIARQYNVNKLDDSVIYIILSLALTTSLSDLDERIKNAYRMLGHVMLRKKRQNTDITELAHLESGELPIPSNGKIDTFYSYMRNMSKETGIKVKPMTMWYAICLALGNSNLINKQLIHCLGSIEEDFGKINALELLSKIRERFVQTYTSFELPCESALDYTCLITMDDTSEVGGYRFLAHNNVGGSTCEPIYVLSEIGYEGLLRNEETSVCPICYTSLTADDFERVGQKPTNSKINIFDEKTPNVFVDRAVAKNRTSNCSIVTPKRNGTIIFMKGVVGSGKSTYSHRIKTRIEEMGGACMIIGTDKYCKTGLSVPDAVNKIQEELSNIDTITNELLVIIIDTCGERDNADNIFGYNFRAWKKINVWVNLDKARMEQYLSWTIRNVLQRNRPTFDSNHWLNPEDATVKVCTNVHASKAKALFGKKIPKLFVQCHNMNKDDAISFVNTRANEYQQYLDNNMPLDGEINKIIQKIV